MVTAGIWGQEKLQKAPLGKPQHYCQKKKKREKEREREAHDPRGRPLREAGSPSLGKTIRPLGPRRKRSTQEGLWMSLQTPRKVLGQRAGGAWARGKPEATREQLGVRNQAALRHAQPRS